MDDQPIYYSQVTREISPKNHLQKVVQEELKKYNNRIIHHCDLTDFKNSIERMIAEKERENPECGTLVINWQDIFSDNSLGLFLRFSTLMISPATLYKSSQ